MKKLRLYHWRIKTNWGWLDAIGHMEADAIERLLRSEKLLNPSRTVVAIVGSGVVGREVDDDYYRFISERAQEQEKIKHITSLCKTASQIIKVCEAIGFDSNKALGYWACTPREKNSA